MDIIKVMKIIEKAKPIMVEFTLFFMWVASSLFLAENASGFFANLCFYGGVFAVLFRIITIPKVKGLIIMLVQDNEL